MIVLVGERQDAVKRHTARGVVLGRQLSFVRLHNRSAQGQTQSQAGRLGSDERFEHRVELIRGDPGTDVLDREAHALIAWRSHHQNVPITCGGVVVSPGDLVVADEIGVTIVPLANAREVLRLAREQAEREQTTREWVSKGKTIEDLLREFGRI